jgi:HSP20 family molecular chaperone IbpA
MHPKVTTIATVSDFAIRIQVPGLRTDAVKLTVEGGDPQVLRVVGNQRDGCGSFETFVDIPAGFDVALGRAYYWQSVLRIDFQRLNKWPIPQFK